LEEDLMRRVQIFTLLTIFVLIIGAKRRQFTNNFHITINNKYYSVVSPPEFKKNITVVIENKTLSKIIGRVVEESDKEYKETFVTLLPRKFKSTTVSFTGKNKVYFVPMAPSLQTIDLIFGKGSYEVPPQNK
jgi:hypothetical protein